MGKDFSLLLWKCTIHYCGINYGKNNTIVYSVEYKPDINIIYG